MEIKKIDIGRGIELGILDTDKFKSCYYSVSFMLPLAYETAAANTLVALTLARACEKYPTLAMRTRAQNDLYDAQITTIRRQVGEVQQIGFVSDTIDDRCLPGDTNVFEKTAQIMREMLFHPLTDKNDAFVADIVEKEKSNLTDDIRALINNKTSYASFRLRSEMCSGEAYGVFAAGDEASISAQTPKSLYRRYCEIIRTAPIRVFFVGNTDGLDVERITRELFDGVEREPSDIPKTEILRSAESVKYVNEEQPSIQGKLCMGFRTGCVMGEQDYAAAVVMNEIYGNSPTAKLFMNVREKLSLCYYCRSVYETVKGILTVSAGIDNANRDAAEREILAQLKAIADGDVSEQDMASAKRSIVNSVREAYDSAFSQDNFYFARYLSSISQSPEEFISAIEKVELEQVCRAARNLTLDTVYFLKGNGNMCDEGEYDED